MKKFLAIALLALFGLQAQAQIVSSRSSMIVKQKNPRNFMWTVRLGYSADSYTGSSDMKSASGFDGALGFTKYANNEGRRDGFFWGVEAVCMTNSGKWEPVESETFAVGVYGAPRVGYKIPVVDNIAIAPYAGAYVGFMFEADEERVWKTDNLSNGKTYTTYSFEPGDCVSFGFTIGAELFLSKSFFIDMHIRKSLAEDGETITRSSSDIITSYNKYGNPVYSYYSNPEIKDKVSGFKFSIGCGFQF